VRPDRRPPSSDVSRSAAGLLGDVQRIGLSLPPSAASSPFVDRLDGARSSASSEHGSRGGRRGGSSQHDGSWRRPEGVRPSVDGHSSSDALRVGLRTLSGLADERRRRRRSSLAGLPPRRGDDVEHGSKQSTDGAGLGRGGLQSTSEHPAQQLSSSSKNIRFTSSSSSLQSPAVGRTATDGR